MKKIEDLFTVRYGVNLELNSLLQCTTERHNSVYFVSRTSKNNGVSAIVERIADIEPIPAGTITVAAGGSVLATFLQPKPYYSGRDLFYLIPKVEMTDKMKLYYCCCIRANKYRYNYGRQANKTLKEIPIPNLNEIPSWVDSMELPKYENLSSNVMHKEIFLDYSNWQPFKYEDIFTIERGDSVYLQDMNFGKYPYISATSMNNGISAFVNRKNHCGNAITLAYDGSIGEAFYQDSPFFASEKIVVINLKNYKLNKYIAMFLIALIKQEKFRYNYGLKWSVESRMKKSIIKLPVTSNGDPDFEFMENYIKTLNYSSSI